MSRQDVARAMAFFESSTDLPMLQSLLRSIRPRAASQVAGFERRGRDVPPPAEIQASTDAAGQEEAQRIVRDTQDFAELQALSRAIGGRIEALLTPQ